MRRLLILNLVCVLSTCMLKAQALREKDHFPVNTALVTPNPNEGAAKLYQFLLDNYGVKIISGVMTLDSFDETDWLKENTGKEPALVGIDFMHCGRGYTWYNDQQPIEDARAYYARNGIPAFNWHWRDPSRTTEAFYTADTDFNIMKIFEPASPEYAAMIADIDYISGLLKQLQEENIPVIWRPLHEAAGGWFWWGAKGAAPCKELYQVMFDRMVNYHGLNNLIWVWTREQGDDLWYPGDTYVDIVGRDIYKEGDHSSHIDEWDDMNERYSRKKMIAMSECGSFPDPDNLVADGAAWSWFMPWYGSFVKESKYNSLALWQKTMNHDYVITLDEMPDLKTYEGVEHPVTSTEKEITGKLIVYPTRVNELIEIKSDRRIGALSVLNVYGQTILRFSVRGSSSQISLASLSPGMYYLRSGTGDLVKVIKN